MEYALVFVGGVLLGILIHAFVDYRFAAHGFFIIEQINEDEGMVNMRIPNAADQELMSKKTIILKRERTQK